VTQARVLVMLTAGAIVVSSALAHAQNKAAEDKAAKAALELKACGPKDQEVNFAADTDKKSHPTPEPSAGKGMIYVLRPTGVGGKVQTKLAVDGDWKGANRGNNYFFLELAPGDHDFCSQAENRSLMTVKVEAGKTYYIQQHVTMGFLKAGNSLEVMDDAVAKEKLAKLNLATWTVKKK